jgi:hypothetical protein
VKNNKNSNCLVSSPCASCMAYGEETISVYSGQHFTMCLLHSTRQSDHFCPFWIALCRVPHAWHTATKHKATPRAVYQHCHCPRAISCFFFCRVPHKAHIKLLYHVCDKRHMTKSSLPSAGLPCWLCRGRRTAKALPYAKRSLPCAEQPNSGSVSPMFKPFDVVR